MIVRVLIPFIDKKTGKEQKVGKKLNISAERLAEIRSVSVNMVEVVEDKNTKE